MRRLEKGHCKMSITMNESGNGTWQVWLRYKDWTGKTKVVKKRGFKTMCKAKE